MSTEDAPLPKAPAIPGAPPRMLVVQAPYYREIGSGLLWGARRILDEATASYEVLDVAGAFELPQAIRLATRGNRGFEGYVALGCVVRGETDHYDFICQATMQGLMQVALQFGLALGSGLLTGDRLEHAGARARLAGFNNGGEAAAAALLQGAAARRLGAA